MQVYQELTDLLTHVSAGLPSMGLWQTQPPAAEALASTEPFAVDNLSFNQWLQFIFVPRMQQIIASQSPLPESCSIAPMAEEFFSQQQNLHPQKSAAMLEHLAALDRLITHN